MMNHWLQKSSMGSDQTQKNEHLERERKDWSKEEILSTLKGRELFWVPKVKWTGSYRDNTQAKNKGEHNF